MMRREFTYPNSLKIVTVRPLNLMNKSEATVLTSKTALCGVMIKLIYKNSRSHSPDEIAIVLFINGVTFLDTFCQLERFE